MSDSREFDLPKIRAGLKTSIKTVNGLTVVELTSNPIPPCAIVYPNAPFEFNADWDGLHKPNFSVLILVPYNNVQDAQSRLDKFLMADGPTSVKYAIERDTTLGGVVSSTAVTELSAYGVQSMSDGGTEYLSATLGVEIYT